MTSQQPKQGGIGHTLFGAYADYARRIAPIFMLCCFLFGFSLGMGYLLGGSLSSSIMTDLLGSLPDTSQMILPELFGFIAANNIVKSLIFMLGGVLGSVLPIFFVVFNGFIVGYVAYSIGSLYGTGFVVAGLVPHGIFEISAILFSMSLGVSLGYTTLNSLRGQKVSLKDEAKQALGLFITRVIPILLLAAAIETLITPAILIQLGYV